MDALTWSEGAPEARGAAGACQRSEQDTDGARRLLGQFTAALRHHVDQEDRSLPIFRGAPRLGGRPGPADDIGKL